VHDAFADAQILAEPHGVKVELLACDALTVRGDRIVCGNCCSTWRTTPLSTTSPAAG